MLNKRQTNQRQIFIRKVPYYMRSPYPNRKKVILRVK